MPGSESGVRSSETGKPETPNSELQAPNSPRSGAGAVVDGVNLTPFFDPPEGEEAPAFEDLGKTLSQAFGVFGSEGPSVGKNPSYPSGDHWMIMKADRLLFDIRRSSFGKIVWHIPIGREGRSAEISFGTGENSRAYLKLHAGEAWLAGPNKVALFPKRAPGDRWEFRLRINALNPVLLQCLEQYSFTPTMEGNALVYQDLAVRVRIEFPPTPLIYSLPDARRASFNESSRGFDPVQLIALFEKWTRQGPVSLPARDPADAGMLELLGWTQRTEDRWTTTDGSRFGHDAKKYAEFLKDLAPAFHQLNRSTGGSALGPRVDDLRNFADELRLRLDESELKPWVDYLREVYDLRPELPIEELFGLDTESSESGVRSSVPIPINRSVAEIGAAQTTILEKKSKVRAETGEPKTPNSGLPTPGSPQGGAGAVVDVAVVTELVEALKKERETDSDLRTIFVDLNSGISKTSYLDFASPDESEARGSMGAEAQSAVRKWTQMLRVSLKAQQISTGGIHRLLFDGNLLAVSENVPDRSEKLAEALRRLPALIKFLSDARKRSRMPSHMVQVVDLDGIGIFAVCNPQTRRMDLVAIGLMASRVEDLPEVIYTRQEFEDSLQAGSHGTASPSSETKKPGTRPSPLDPRQDDLQNESRVPSPESRPAPQAAGALVAEVTGRTLDEMFDGLAESGIFTASTTESGQPQSTAFLIPGMAGASLSQGSRALISTREDSRENEYRQLILEIEPEGKGREEAIPSMRVEVLVKEGDGTRRMLVQFGGVARGPAFIMENGIWDLAVREEDGFTVYYVLIPDNSPKFRRNFQLTNSSVPQKVLFVTESEANADPKKYDMFKRETAENRPQTQKPGTRPSSLDPRKDDLQNESQVPSPESRPASQAPGAQDQGAPAAEAAVQESRGEQGEPVAQPAPAPAAPSEQETRDLRPETPSSESGDRSSEPEKSGIPATPNSKLLAPDSPAQQGAEASLVWSPPEGSLDLTPLIFGTMTGEEAVAQLQNSDFTAKKNSLEIEFYGNGSEKRLLEVASWGLNLFKFIKPEANWYSHFRLDDHWLRFPRSGTSQPEISLIDRDNIRGIFMIPAGKSESGEDEFCIVLNRWDYPVYSSLESLVGSLGYARVQNETGAWFSDSGMTAQGSENSRFVVRGPRSPGFVSMDHLPPFVLSDHKSKNGDDYHKVLNALDVLATVFKGAENFRGIARTPASGSEEALLKMMKFEKGGDNKYRPSSNAALGSVVKDYTDFFRGLERCLSAWQGDTQSGETQSARQQRLFFGVVNFLAPYADRLDSGAMRDFVIGALGLRTDLPVYELFMARAVRDLAQKDENALKAVESLRDRLRDGMFDDRVNPENKEVVVLTEPLLNNLFGYLKESGEVLTQEQVFRFMSFLNVREGEYRLPRVLAEERLRAQAEIFFNRYFAARSELRKNSSKLEVRSSKKTTAGHASLPTSNVQLPFTPEEEARAISEIDYAVEKGFLVTREIPNPNVETRNKSQVRISKNPTRDLSDFDIVSDFGLRVSDFSRMIVVENPVKLPGDDLFLHLDAEDILWTWDSGSEPRAQSYGPGSQPLASVIPERFHRGSKLDSRLKHAGMTNMELGELTFNIDGNQAYFMTRTAEDGKQTVYVRGALYRAFNQARNTKREIRNKSEGSKTKLKNSNLEIVSDFDIRISKISEVIRESVAFVNRTVREADAFRAPQYLLLTPEVIARNYGIARTIGFLASQGHRIFVRETQPIAPEFFRAHGIEGLVRAGALTVVRGDENETLQDIRRAARKQVAAKDVVLVDFVSSTVPVSFTRLILDEGLLGASSERRADYPVPFLAARLKDDPSLAAKLGEKILTPLPDGGGWVMHKTPAYSELSGALVLELTRHLEAAQSVSQSA